MTIITIIFLIYLAILAADPHETAVDEIKNIPVLRTIIGGKTVFEA